MKRIKGKNGRYECKSKTPRKTKTIRTTDENWEEFGNLAESRDMTRADLLEVWVSNYVTHRKNMDQIQHSENHVSHSLVDRAIKILEQGLKLRANAGGKIKTKIRDAISLLEGEE